MIYGFKVRLYPSKKQEELMWKHVNAVRWVYNWGLEKRKTAYTETGKNLSYVDQSALLTQFKRTTEGEWLKEANASTLVSSLRDLETAYTNFFRKKKGFPKFKSRRTARSAFAVAGAKTYFDDHSTCTLPTIGKVQYQSSYNLPTGRTAIKMLNPRVTFENGKWLLTFSMEVANRELPKLNDFSCGVDLGIKTLITASYDGQVLTVPNINKEQRIRRKQRRLARAQRRLSRAKKGSNRREKARKAVAVQHRTLKNIRLDHTHKATRKIINLLPKRLVLEDLNVRGMLFNRHLARAVSECGFAELRRQLEYKSQALGIELVLADRFYPSSKTCSSCGDYHKTLTLKDRVFACPSCNTSLDRDINAAINLENYSPTKGSLALK